jgi:hypothetical protein
MSRSNSLPIIHRRQRRSFSFSEQTILETETLTITITRTSNGFQLNHGDDIIPMSASSASMFGAGYSTPEIIIDNTTMVNPLNIPIQPPQFSTSNFETLETKIGKALNKCTKTDTCSICLEDSNEVQLNCGHVFHKDCITQIIKNSCPMCRAVIF